MAGKDPLEELGLPSAKSPLAELGLPDPDIVPPDKRQPRGKYDPRRDPRFARRYERTPENIEREGKDAVVPEYPVEAAASLIPGFKAAQAAGALLPKTLPWLARSAAAGAAGGATGGAIAESGKGPVEAAKGAAVGAAAGAVLSPPLEKGLQVAGAAVAPVVGRLRPKPPLKVVPPPEPVTAPVPEAPATPPVAAPAPATAAPEAVPGPTPTQTRTGPQTGATVPQQVRLDKFGLVEGGPEYQTVEQTLASLGLGTRRVRTFADMKSAAEELGMRPEDLLKGAAQRPISDAEVVATANLINEASTLHAQATARLAAPGVTDAERIALTQQQNGALKQIQDLLKRRIRGGTESGRAIAAFRIIGQRNLDPAYWYTIATKRSGADLTPALKGAIDAAIAAQDRLALAQIVGRLGQAGWADKLATLMRAGMLSNPGTDVRNVLGTGVGNVMNAAADLPANALDFLLSRFTGIRSKSLSLRQAREAVRGVGEGVKKAGEVLRYGDTEENLLARYDFNSNVHFDKKALEVYTQAVFRRLGAEDQLFRQPELFRATAELAEVVAKNDGLRGRAFLDRVEELIRNPTDEIREAAQASAAYRTFNQESALASGLQAFERRLGPGGRLVGAAVMPFKRTPINVANTILDFSPFGVPKTFFGLLSRKGASPMLRQRYVVEGLGRAVTGTTLAAYGYALARAGLATGGPPEKGDVKNARRAQGIPDYAVRVGDQWVSLKNNAPAANVLMLGVDAYQQMQRDDATGAEQAAGMAGALWKGVSEQTFVKGVKQATEAATDPGRFGSDWLEGTAGIIVPSIVGAVARGTDPVERRINNPLEAVQSRVPGWRQGLEPQVTIAGEDRPQRTGVLGQIASPVRTAPVDRSLVARALEHARYAPGVPTQRKWRVDGREVELTERELTEYQREVGRAQWAAMEARVGGEGFLRLDPDEAKQRLKRAADDAEGQVRRRWKSRKAGR